MSPSIFYLVQGAAVDKMLLTVYRAYTDTPSATTSADAGTLFLFISYARASPFMRTLRGIIVCSDRGRIYDARTPRGLPRRCRFPAGIFCLFLLLLPSCVHDLNATRCLCLQTHCPHGDNDTAREDFVDALDAVNLLRSLPRSIFSSKAGAFADTTCASHTFPCVLTTCT